MRRALLVIAFIVGAPLLAADDMKMIGVDHQEQFTVTIKGQKFSLTRAELSDLADEADKALGPRVAPAPVQGCFPTFRYNVQENPASSPGTQGGNNQ